MPDPPLLLSRFSPTRSAIPTSDYRPRIGLPSPFLYHYFCALESVVLIGRLYVRLSLEPFITSSKKKKKSFIQHEEVDHFEFVLKNNPIQEGEEEDEDEEVEEEKESDEESESEALLCLSLRSFYSSSKTLL
ncbi:hypothetical protein COCNU_01G012450 [Cocos nucifera]|uniref:Uncharacterized protein n=1 Tax=Cocos nucifera TaxID=13894 RepID=A0A8K0MUS5_COCNU|nr:hypothetical protein COCNU_01G012450 [Cocos nucifera]